MNPNSAETKRNFPRQQLFYVVWGSLLLSTLMPVKSVIHWYEELQRSQGIRITGPINASASQVISLIRQNLPSFCWQLLAIVSRALFKWLLVAGIFWLFLSRLSLPRRFYNCCEGTVNKIKTASRGNLLTIAFLATLLITCALSYRIHWFFPDYPDNVVQLYQAKLFKQGKLSIPPPPNGREFFWYPLIIKRADRWYPRYEPGHPFMLMLGLLIGMPWLVNPILGCLSIIMLYKLGLEIYGEDTARLGLVLLLFSPFFLTVSSGFLNNASAMLFSLAGIYYFVKTVKYPSLLYPLLSGLFLGAVANVRPFTGFLIALPLGVYLLYLFFKQPRRLALKISAACLGLAVTISVLLYYNYLTNGHPLLFGQTAMIMDGNFKTLGFGKALYGITHTPFRAAVRLLEKLNQLNFSLFGWPIPSLAFIFFFFLPRFEKNRWDYLFLAIILCLVTGYYFFFALKVRYLYALTPLLVLLTARGMMGLFQLLKGFGWGERGIKSAVYALIPVFFGYMVYTCILPQLTPSGKQKHRLYRLVKQKQIHNAIIFLPSGFSGWGIYGQGFVHNDPEFKGDVLYAHYRGKNNIKLMQQYPNRRYYFFDLRPDDSYRFLEIKPGDYSTSKQPPLPNNHSADKRQ
jgi:hypothetical protein